MSGRIAKDCKKEDTVPVEMIGDCRWCCRCKHCDTNRIKEGNKVRCTRYSICVSVFGFCDEYIPK